MFTDLADSSYTFTSATGEDAWLPAATYRVTWTAAIDGAAASLEYGQSSITVSCDGGVPPNYGLSSPTYPTPPHPHPPHHHTHDYPPITSRSVPEPSAPTGPCVGVKCQNGGICSGGICACVYPFTGTNCETSSDPCMGHDCNKGHCVALGTEATCVCTASLGYSGPHCTWPPMVEPEPACKDTCADSTKNGHCQDGYFFGERPAKYIGCPAGAAT
jgi:hypothetical protein